MSNDDVNKYLTEAMGECWHENIKWREYAGAGGTDIHKLSCGICGKDMFGTNLDNENNNFFTPDGFFKLKTFMESHENTILFWDNYLDHVAERTDVVAENFKRITPDSLANFAYRFLKETQ